MGRDLERNLAAAAEPGEQLLWSGRPRAKCYNESGTRGAPPARSET